ncbi:hypothetical protein [Formosa sp. L2A11]|uniref:hypothetical protein n=1 Tax=Formosa sp. L2A11 TaxID=2686363 RepID=UPI00131B71FE|nr:hypothetical protein [Formosa sp. L2A11]
MDSNQLEVINNLKNKETQLIFLSAVKKHAIELDKETEVFNLIKKQVTEKINQSDQFSQISANQKSEIINLGFEIIQNAIETKLINLNGERLKELNNLNELQFLNVFNNKLSLFKEKVIKNQSDFEKIKTLGSENTISSLTEMSKIINYNSYEEEPNSIENDVDTFLNGGDLQF